jgi:trk system potassium uptake protein TrkA
MKILITEGHRKTYYLLDAFTKNHKIVVINKDKNYCKDLSRLFPHVTIVHGDATKPYLLDDAQIFDFDLSIHLSNEDKENLVTALMVKKHYKIKRAVSVVNDSKNADVFTKLGIESTIDTSRVIAGIIEQHAFVDRLKTYVPLEDENLVIVDLEISEDSPSIGKKIQALDLPESAILTAIFRNKKAIIPKGQTIIEKGDRVVVTTLKKVQSKVIKTLGV